MRKSVLLLCAGLILAEPRKPPDAPGDQPPVFTVSTTVVQVDAEVTDGKGRHVRDLRPSDFEITLDRRKQPITNFSYVDLSQGVNGLPPGAEPHSEVRAEYVKRAIVVLVDDLSVDFTQMPYVRKAIHDFVNHDLQPNDLVAIWQTGRINMVFQQLTSDKALLNAAVDALQWNPRGQGMLSMFEDPVNREEGRQNRLGDAAPFEPETRGERDEAAYLRSGLVAGAIGMMEGLVTELQQVNGRKAVVLFSPGLNMDNIGINDHAGGSDFDTRLRQMLRSLVDSANRAGAVIYPIDTRGLVAGLKPGIGVRMGPSQQAAEQLAGETGGFATFNGNGFREALQTIREDQNGYYLLGFKAPPDIASKLEKNQKVDFHSLRVSLKKKGLEIRSRQGFWGVTDQLAKERYQSPRAQMTTAMLSLFSHDDVHVRLTPLYARMNDGQAIVRNFIYIDGNDVAFLAKPDGKHEAKLNLLVTATGVGSDLLANASKDLVMDADDSQMQQLRREGILLKLDVPVKNPGPYQIRAAVRDTQSQKLGSAGEFLDVPDLKKVHFAFTTPVLKNAVGDADDRSIGLRQFHPGSTISFASLLEMNAGDHLLDSGVRVSIEVISGDKVVIQRELPVKPLQGIGEQGVRGELKLSGSLPAGQYYFEAIATTPGAKKARTATGWADFEVVP